MSDTKLPNGIYTVLKDKGRETIETLNIHFKENLKQADRLDRRDYGLDFTLYGIDFRIRFEISTDCEMKGEAFLAVYRIVEGDNSVELVPFPIWPNGIKSESQHRLRIEYKADNDCPIEFPEYGKESTVFKFFTRRFPRIVAEAAIPIDLDK